jgi:uncharacterized protein (UPF0332 family)
MENNKELIKFRVERCDCTIDEAKIAIDLNKLHLAYNRIYYSIYYIVSALSLKSNFATSKHSGLLAWFNKEFINTDIVSKDFGKIYYKAFENRQESDYEDLITYNIEDVKSDYENMLKFVNEVKKLVVDKN